MYAVKCPKNRVRYSGEDVIEDLAHFAASFGSG